MSATITPNSPADLEAAANFNLSDVLAVDQQNGAPGGVTTRGLTGAQLVAGVASALGATPTGPVQPNQFLVGPASGEPSPLGLRNIVSADLPAATNSAAGAVTLTQISSAATSAADAAAAAALSGAGFQAPAFAAFGTTNGTVADGGVVAGYATSISSANSNASAALSNASAALSAANAAAAKALNLSDLSNIATARVNLGLAGAAVLNVGTGLTTASGSFAVAYGTAAGTALQGSLFGAAGGVAPLDGTSKVPIANLPAVATLAGTQAQYAVLAGPATGTGAAAWRQLASTDISGFGTAAAAAAPVQTVAGRTGSVTLAYGDVSGLGGAAVLSVGAGHVVSGGNFAVAYGTAAGTALQGSMLNATNGVAPLDGTGKVPLANISAALLGGNHYIGTWNPGTNTPAVVSGTSPGGLNPVGSYYVASSSATLGTAIDGITTITAGDWITWNGTIWQKLDGQANPVSSVAGRQGAVTLATGDITGFSSAASAAAPVQTVAGRTGAITLATGDIAGFASAAASAAPVQTVAGRTGAVALAYADVSGLSSMAQQAASSVAVTGGAINGTAIGGSVAAAGTFTTIAGAASAATVVPTGSGYSALAFGDFLGNLNVFSGASIFNTLANTQAYAAQSVDLYWQKWQNGPFNAPPTNDLTSGGIETNTSYGIGAGGGVSNVNFNTFVGYGAGARITFTGSISSGILTISNVTSGSTVSIYAGASFTFPGQSTAITIGTFGAGGTTGTGGNGTYQVTGAPSTVVSTLMYLVSGNACTAVGYGALNRSSGTGQDTAFGALASKSNDWWV
jgi:hypothetical protein